MNQNPDEKEKTTQGRPAEPLKRQESVSDMLWRDLKIVRFEPEPKPPVNAPAPIPPPKRRGPRR